MTIKDTLLKDGIFKDSSQSQDQGFCFNTHHTQKNLFYSLLLFFSTIPLRSQGGCWSHTQLHIDEGRMHPWMSSSGPNQSTWGFGFFLKVTSTVLWRCSGNLPCYQNISQVLYAPGLEPRKWYILNLIFNFKCSHRVLFIAFWPYGHPTSQQENEYGGVWMQIDSAECLIKLWLKKSPKWTKWKISILCFILLPITKPEKVKMNYRSLDLHQPQKQEKVRSKGSPFSDL